jgi:hypothetical protein
VQKPVEIRRGIISLASSAFTPFIYFLHPLILLPNSILSPQKGNSLNLHVHPSDGRVLHVEFPAVQISETYYGVKTTPT